MKDENNFINTFLIFIAFTWLLLLTGGIFNLTVITLNGGKMPVLSNNKFESKEHFTYTNTSEINRFYLSDVMKFNLTDYTIYYSLGDIFILASGILFLSTTSVYVYWKIKMRKQNVNTG